MQRRLLAGALFALCVAVAPAVPAAESAPEEQDRSWTGRPSGATADNYRLGWAVGFSPTRPGRLTSASLAVYDWDQLSAQTGVVVTLTRSNIHGEPGGAALGTVRLEPEQVGAGESVYEPGVSGGPIRWVDLRLEQPAEVDPTQRYWLTVVPDEPLVYGLSFIPVDSLQQGKDVRQELRIINGDTGEVRAGSGITSFRSYLTQRTATTLRVPPALAVAPALGELSAVLESAGEPVAGRRIAFHDGGSQLCSGTTDAAGRAACRPAPGLPPTSVRATFTGDADHGPSAADRTLVELPAQPARSLG